MNKPTNPNVIVPAQFATNGVKIGFTQKKIKSGFSNSAADVLAGDNLNQFIDDVYKSITYSNAGVADLYKSAVIYDGAETYRANDIVFNVNNGSVTLYRSLANNNTGNPLTNNTKWQQVQLGADILGLVQPYGMPIPMPKNVLPDGLDAANSSYIWLTGQAVSRTTYANLFAVYGTLFGNGNGSTTFNLPNYNARYIYCDSSFGYIAAGLPNLGLATESNGAHTHEGNTLNAKGTMYGECSSGSGVFKTTAVKRSSAAGQDDKAHKIEFSTSGKWSGSTSSSGAHTHTITASNKLYGAANTIQTAGVKHKVCTRWR